jgi:hypothetical protein
LSWLLLHKSIDGGGGCAILGFRYVYQGSRKEMELLNTHGGKRVGSGRPRTEETKVIRVPLGCLNAVSEIISNYKASPSAPVSSSDCSLNNLDLFSIDIGENKRTPKKSIKWFNRKNDPLNDLDRAKIRSAFGSLDSFIKRGGRISKNTAVFPSSYGGEK